MPDQNPTAAQAVGRIGIALALVTVLAISGIGLSVASISDLTFEHGARASRALDQTGFPHATTASVETYQFIGKTLNGVERVTFQVDWTNHTMSVTDAEEGNATLVARFPPGTYELAKERFDSLQRGETPTTDPEGVLSAFWHIVMRSSITISGESWWQAHTGNAGYKMSIMHWAASTIHQANTGKLKLNE